MSRPVQPDAALNWRPTDDPPPDAWPALYAAGLTCAEIGQRTGHSPMQVWKELRGRGVVMRRQGPRSGVNSAWHEAAAALRADGYSYAAIGRELGQARATVQMALLRRAKRAVQQPVSPGYPVEPMDSYDPDYGAGY